MKTETPICPECERAIDADAPSGLCPECLLGFAVSEGSKNMETLPRQGVFNAPAAEELSNAIDGIEVQELLGHGGMGAVYYARQINLDRPVALKILSPKLGNDPGFAERFSREAKTLARLNHSNIVTVYDFGKAGDYCYLVMELVEGVNLRDAIVSGGISPEQALSIVPRVCEALQYAHDQGVVHRDIKPENILVGVNGQVKIADFGLAKLLDHSEANFTLTATQQVLGTRNYMAPEQIEKPTTVDHRADIYSLGVVFYELLTGELPLGRFSLPSEKADVSNQMDEVVLRALEKEPGRRYQMASEIKTAVESIDLSKESPLSPYNGMESRQPVQGKPPVIQSAMHSAGTEEKRQAKPTGGGSAGRRISLPFKNDQVHGGLSQLHGIAHLNPHELEIEFRVHKLGLSKSARKVVTIPYSRLVQCIVNRGMFSDSLEIHATTLDAMDEIPGTSQGCLKMILEKNHGQLLSDFQDGLDQRLAVQNANSPESQMTTLAHVPFKIPNVHGGFSEAAGIAKVTNQCVLVEFEVKDAMGVVKTSARRANVPFEEIIAARFKYGVFSDSIEIQTNGIDNVSSVPNSSQGKFLLTLKQRDRKLAYAWMREVCRATGVPLQPELVERKPASIQEEKTAFQSKLNNLSIGLLVSMLLNAGLASATFVLTIMSNAEAESWVGRVTNTVCATLGISDNPNDWYTYGMVGPAIGAVVCLLMFMLVKRRKGYSLVLVGAVLLVFPWHFGVIASIGVGIWALVIMMNYENRLMYCNRT